MGITRVANVTGLDRVGIPVVMTCRPNARSISVSQGKGLTLEDAIVSGLMEAVEAYHAEHITLPLKLASWEELRYTHAVANLADLPRSAENRFERDLPLLWIEGRDLLSETRLWLPFELVHANYTLPLPPGSGCFAANTNGLASGNHRLEALLHGICEVVERDAVTLWHWLDDEARAAKGVDPDTIDDPDCRAVLGKFDRAGVKLTIWDVTSDLGLPAYYCLALQPDDELGQPADGSGCHTVREVALLRALTEAAQVRTTYIAGSRDDIGPEEYSPAFRADRLRHCQELLACHQPIRDLRTAPSQDGVTFEEDLAWVLDRLRATGIGQVIAVDLSQPAFRLPVVRVVIPGLEGADENDDYVPGRRVLALRQQSR
jgi:ribosomal protein S12 methylthiotransferase accessory factor